VTGYPFHSPLAVVLDMLAVWRLTRLVIRDAFPPVRRPVDAIVRRADHRALERGRPESFLGTLLTCPWCVSIYVGAVVVTLRCAFPVAWPYVAFVLAASGVAGVLAEHE
jgi:hypothetical protein